MPLSQQSRWCCRLCCETEGFISWHLKAAHGALSNERCTLRVMEVGGGEVSDQILRRLEAKSEYALARGTAVLLLFLGLWSANLYIFKVANIDISGIYPAKLTGCTPRRIGSLTGALLGVAVCCALFWCLLLGGEAQHSPGLFYVLLAAAVIFPMQYTLYIREFASFFGRVLHLVFMPGDEVHFIEVLVGDVLTSLSKSMMELGISFVAFFLGLSLVDFTTIPPDILPTVLASIPFCLRIRQCWVQYRGATTSTARLQTALNILKYLSSLPGLWLPMLMRPYASNREIERTLLWVLLVNSLYSFIWDVVMDWGLGQLGARHCGLRHTLLFGSSCVYYAAILVDLGLRVVWVLRYIEVDHVISYDKFMLLIEVLEVVRRSMWIIFRIEWECLSKGYVNVMHPMRVM